MKNQDSTEKDAKIPTDAEAKATSKAGEEAEAKKELTDDQIAGVVGGIQGNHIGYEK